MPITLSRSALALAAFAMGLAGSPAVRATSVIPPTFPELVAEADSIVRGRVIDITTRRATAPDGTPVIKTFVTFAVERTLKGAANREVTLEILGGTIGDESLVVTGLPRFELGASDYLFIERNGVQFCPLVAVRHGRYRLLRDAAGREFVARDNAVALTDVAQVVLPLTDLPPALRAAGAAGALSPVAFEAAVIAEAARAAGNARTR